MLPLVWSQRVGSASDAGQDKLNNFFFRFLRAAENVDEGPWGKKGWENSGGRGSELFALFSSEAGWILASIGWQAAAAGCALSLAHLLDLDSCSTFIKNNPESRSRCGVELHWTPQQYQLSLAEVYRLLMQSFSDWK